MLDQLFASQFVILAVFINMIIFLIFNTIKPIITKGRGENSDFGLPRVAVRNLILTFVFGVSFLITWGAVNVGYITPIKEGIFLTSAWCAILSTLTYNIGIKEIMEWFTKAMGNKIK